MKRALTILCIAMAMTLVSMSRDVALARQTAGGAADEAVQVPELVIRVYEVASLVVVAPQYRYQGTTVPQISGIGRPGFAGAGFTSGGGGLGGGRGGGFFQVRPEQLSQFGAGTQQSGGIRGGGGGFGGVAPIQVVPAPAVPFPRDFTSLINVITTSIHPDSWTDVGGEGTCDAFGSKLVIAQTAEIHAKVETLLDALGAEGSAAQTVTIEALWLALDSQQLDSIFADAGNGSQSVRDRIDRQRLRDLASTVPTIRGRISSFNGQTVYIVSGLGRTKVQGATPVVGSRAAYQPIITLPQPGALLQIATQVVDQQKAVVIDVKSTVARWGTAGETVRLGSPAASEDEGAEADVVDPVVIVDRMEVTAQQLATTLRVPVGVPVLVGGLTFEPMAENAEGGGNGQVYLFVEVNVQGG